MKLMPIARPDQAPQAGREPAPLSVLAYERIKEAIQNGDLRPSDPLYETHLSEALQISRTPVREALRLLAQDGLVRVTPNRAVTVASLTMQELFDVLQVRLIVEPEIIRLVAEGASTRTIESLRRTVATMLGAAQRGDRMAWVKADSVYHETICNACPNALLGQVGLRMRNRLQFLVSDTQITPAWLMAFTYEHRAIVSLIEHRDGQKAMRQRKTHMQQLHTRLFERLVYP